MLLSAVKQTPSGLLKKVLELPEGSTVGDALRALNWQTTEEIGLSIYGRRCKEEDLLKEIPIAGGKNSIVNLRIIIFCA